MKLGQVTKLDKKRKTASKNFGDNVMSVNCDIIVMFPIFAQFGAIRKPDSGRIVCKTYIFISSDLLSYKSWKQNWKISYTTLTLLSKDTVFAKKCWFFAKKPQNMLTSAKLRGPWYWKIYFLKVHMCLNIRIKFEIPSIILASFRQGGGGRGVILPSPLHLKTYP